MSERNLLVKSSWCKSSLAKAVAGRSVTSVAIRRVTGGCEAYTVSKQAVRISSEIAHIAMSTPLTRRKAASEPPLCEVNSGSPESLARGMLTNGFPANPGELSASRDIWARCRPTPRHLVPGGRGLPPRKANKPLTRVSCSQGKPEATMNGTREVLRPHSTDEGGEPQGSRKGRPRYPLEGRGEEVDG